MNCLARNVDVCRVETINRTRFDVARVDGLEDNWQKIRRCDDQGGLSELKEMVNLKELVGGVGSNVNASRTNDGEEESRVQVL